MVLSGITRRSQQDFCLKTTGQTWEFLYSGFQKTRIHHGISKSRLINSIAVTIKENVDPEVLIEEPKAVMEEPLPRPETPGTNEDAQAVTEREARDKLARDKVILENEERVARGPKVGHNVFYREVGKRLKSRLFLALGTEDKKKFVQKKTTHGNIETRVPRNGEIGKNLLRKKQEASPTNDTNCLHEHMKRMKL